jgi:hypothetical protein
MANSIKYMAELVGNKLGVVDTRDKPTELQTVRPNVRRNLTYYPDLGIVYFANAKSGTSTIRRTLWNAVDQKRGTQTLKRNPRAHDNSPALSIGHGTLRISGPDEVLDSVFFTVVRHPLVRLVSGYLNKIKPEPNNRFWKFYAKRYGVPIDVQVPFAAFVDHITNDIPHQVDRHFRSQSINICYGFAPFTHIGQLEDLRPTASFLEAHGVPSIETFQPHATGAADYLKDYYSDPGILKTAVDFLEKDFERFNYAPNIENVLPLGPVTPPEVDTTLLRTILQVDATPDKMTGSPPGKAAQSDD